MRKTSKIASALLVAMVMLTMCCKKPEAPPAPPPEAKGKRAVMIIAPQDFRDEELQEPKQVLEEAGAEVTIASSSLEEAKGMLGLTVTPDILLKDVKVEDYDAVVFVGGTGAAVYWDDPTAQAIAKDAVEMGKVVGAICIAPVILANADVLSGKKATVWSDNQADLEKKGATYTGSKVEIDGKIITANGPKAAKEFGEAIAKALANPTCPV